MTHKTEVQELQEYARQVGLCRPEAAGKTKAPRAADTLIVSRETPRDNFTIIPNLLDVIGLSPIAYRLYGHIRRRAGERGKCWESARKMAQVCAMSTFAVHKAKKELAELGLISVKSKKRPGGGHDYHEITIEDIWMLNHRIFSGDGDARYLGYQQDIPANFDGILARCIKIPEIREEEIDSKTN